MCRFTNCRHGSLHLSSNYKHRLTSTWTSLNYVLVPRIQNIIVGEKESRNCLIFITASQWIIVQINCVDIQNCSHLFQNASDFKLGKYRLEINIWYHSSWTSCSLKIAKIGYPQTSVRNYHSTLRKIPTHCGSLLHLGGSLKSRIRNHSFQFLWMKNQTTKAHRFIHISVTFDFRTKAQLYIQERKNPGRPDCSAQYLCFFKTEFALYHPFGA